jgi:hypothetical protein
LGSQYAVSAYSAQQGKLPLILDYLHWFSQPSVFGPVARSVGIVPLVAGVAPLSDFEKHILDWYCARPRLLVATDVLPAEYGSTQYKLVTGYLSGSIDLQTALSQVQTTQMKVVDDLITQNKLHISSSASATGLDWVTARRCGCDTPVT